MCECGGCAVIVVQGEPELNGVGSEEEEEGKREDRKVVMGPTGSYIHRIECGSVFTSVPDPRLFPFKFGVLGSFLCDSFIFYLRFYRK